MEGDKDGCYTNSLNETVVALLPKCQQELENIYLRFEAYQQTRMGLGFRRPEEWEEDLLNERLDIEARGDVSHRGNHRTEKASFGGHCP